MKKMILITGAHRSGTTWTGKIIAAAKKVRIVYEPFNIKQDFKPSNSPIIYWNEYLTNAPNSHQEQARYYLKSFYSILHRDFIKKAFKIRTIRDGYLFLTDLKGRFTDRTLLKDPIAIMSAEWIYENFPCDVIITIRHPAAFVSSLKAKNWHFDFYNLLKQEELMSSYLEEYRDLITEYAQAPPDITHQGIALWNIIYGMVLEYQRKYGDKWYFIKHEDLSNEPIREFGKIFKFLNLKFDHNVQSLIKETTTAQGTNGQDHEHKKDSKTNIKVWKERLTPEEIFLIKTGTEKTWKQYYEEIDWQ